jgi:protein SCO1/2
MQTKTYAIAAGLLTAAMLGSLAGFVLLHRPGDRFAGCVSGESAADLGGPFTLVDAASGRTVTDAEVITKPTLLYFGYTFCPDVCPLDTVRNAEAVDILAERGFDVQSVFVSVDWRRDTPAAVADFVANVHPQMIGLTGSEDQIRDAARAWRVFFNANDPDTDEFFLIDHTTITYLVFPETGFAGFFRRELSGDQLADQVACFLEAAAGA